MWPFPFSFHFTSNKCVWTSVVVWASVYRRVKEEYTQSKEMHNREIWNVGVCGEGSFCLADLHRQLASHVSPRLISNQHRPAHTHVQKHTHILYPSLKRLCSLMPRLDFLSPSFPLPPPLPFRPFGHLCVVRYRQYLLKNCAAVSVLTKERH